MTAALFALSLCAQDALDGALDLFDGETIFEGGLQLTLGNSFRRSSGEKTLLENRATLSANYGLLPQITLAALVPMVWRRQADSSTVIADGIGDAALIAKVRLYKQDWNLGSFNWTVFAGGGLPTGETNERKNGVRLDPTLQPGSGSWDEIVATAATLEMDRFKINGTLFGQINGSGAQNFTPSNVVSVEMTPGYRVIVEPYPGPLMRLDLGFKWSHAFGATQNGSSLDNSGGDVLLMKPALVFWPRPWWGIVLSVELPLYQDLRGSQAERDYGISLAFSMRI